MPIPTVTAGEGTPLRGEGSSALVILELSRGEDVRLNSEAKNATSDFTEKLEVMFVIPYKV